MLERLVITFVIAGGLALLWFGWQYCKSRLIRSVPCAQTPTGKPTLLNFTGHYCAVCEYQQSPIVQQISAKLGNAIAVETFDVACYPGAAKKYKVLTLPTTVILDSAGQVVDINYGLAGQAKLEKQLSSAAQRIPSNIGLVNEFRHAA